MKDIIREAIDKYTASYNDNVNMSSEAAKDQLATEIDASIKAYINSEFGEFRMLPDGTFPEIKTK